MDETTRAIIERITVSYASPQPIPGGHVASVFYDCSQLTPNDLARLAAHAVGHLSEETFDLAVGIAYTGIFFAAAAAGGKHIGILQIDDGLFGPSVKGRKVLIVDDVVSSGSQLKRAKQIISSQGGEVVGCACIVDRSNGLLSSEKDPLWSAYQTDMS